jgi:hypothetical protein
MALTSCTSTYRSDGIENFSKGDSSVSLCQNLIPDDFIDKFEYIEADYHWFSTEKFIAIEARETVIMYFRYLDETYEEAKKYVLDNMLLSNDSTEIYGNYNFLDNFGNGNLIEDGIGTFKFPYNFSRVAYNDNNNTLIFMAFAVSVELYDEAELASEDWGAFLKKYYGEWYSFEE